MADWTEFAALAPRIAEVFTRRHTATGKLCLLGTLRPDGAPRISPMEPALFEGQLWIAGMPGTVKFREAPPQMTQQFSIVSNESTPRR